MIVYQQCLLMGENGITDLFSALREHCFYSYAHVCGFPVERTANGISQGGIFNRYLLTFAYNSIAYQPADTMCVSSADDCSLL